MLWRKWNINVSTAEICLKSAAECWLCSGTGRPVMNLPRPTCGFLDLARSSRCRPGAELGCESAAVSWPPTTFQPLYQCACACSASSFIRSQPWFRQPAVPDLDCCWETPFLVTLEIAQYSAAEAPVLWSDKEENRRVSSAYFFFRKLQGRKKKLKRVSKKCFAASWRSIISITGEAIDSKWLKQLWHQWRVPLSAIVQTGASHHFTACCDGNVVLHEERCEPKSYPVMFNGTV